jgi:hypothetical protein
MSALDRLHEQEIEDLIKIRQHALLSERTRTTSPRGITRA